MSIQKYYHAKDPNRKNGCAPLALSSVTGLDYSIINGWLKMAGYRKHDLAGTNTVFSIRSSIYWKLTHERTTYTFTRITTSGLVSVKTLVNYLLKKDSAYIIEVRGHWLAFRDGVVFDTKDSDRCRVNRVWEVSKESW